MSESPTSRNSENPRAGRPLAARPCRHVVLAEDDEEMRKLIALSLRQDGYHVTECTHGMDPLDHLKAFGGDIDCEAVDLIISDIRMPGVTGISVLEALQQNAASIPMILITAFGDTETHTLAQRLGAVKTFDKPFNIGELLAKVCETIRPHTKPQ